MYQPHTQILPVTENKAWQAVRFVPMLEIKLVLYTNTPTNASQEKGQNPDKAFHRLLQRDDL